MFEIKIIGIEDFIKFVIFIKNSDLDMDKLKELTTKLNESSDKLIEAEKNQGG